MEEDVMSFLAALAIERNRRDIRDGACGICLKEGNCAVGFPSRVSLAAHQDCYDRIKAVAEPIWKKIGDFFDQNGLSDGNGAMSEVFATVMWCVQQKLGVSSLEQALDLQGIEKIGEAANSIELCYKAEKEPVVRPKTIYENIIELVSTWVSNGIYRFWPGRT